MDIKAMFTDLKDYSVDYEKQEKESGKAMAIIAYIGILCLIPYFAEKNNKYVRFHAVQALNLFLINIIYSVAVAVASMILIFVPVLGPIAVMILNVASYGFIALHIWGIVNACQDKAKELPIVNKIKIIKE